MTETNRADLDALQAEHDRVSAWLNENLLDKAGSAECRRLILAHRLLTDLLAADGGTPEMRAAAMRELTAIHAGERDP